MYIPKHFEVTDEDTIYNFIDQHSFGILVSMHEGVPAGTHLPLILDRENKYLKGHFAKPNKQWQDIEGQEVLIIFHGPHHYISASWYETNLSVPTWNYVAVHVYGTLERITEPGELLADLQELTEKYEDSSAASYRIDSSNLAFVEKLMNGIVGFRIRITRMEGTWKLSQNHSEERRERVMYELEKLESDDAKAVAVLMRNSSKNQSKLISR